jgi:hypothetical protein
MYTNIPTSELKNIIKNILNSDHYVSKDEKEELSRLLNIFSNRTISNSTVNFSNDEGLTVGAPMSAILAETFIQYLEHTIIYQILNRNQIIDYYRYVDDILIIYNGQCKIYNGKGNTK